MTQEILDEIVERSGQKQKVILDATVLTSLMNCARLADFRFNHNLQSIKGKGNSFECGSIFHKFAEVYYGALIQGMKREQAFGFGITAAELYIQSCPLCKDFTPRHREDNADGTHTCTSDCIVKPSCGHRPNEFPGLENTPAIVDTSNPKEKYKVGWKWVLETCQQYYDFYKNDHWVPLEVEVVKSKVLYEDDEIAILWKAKLDLTSDTNQGIYPVDHKTMKARRDTIKPNNQFMGQCLIMGTQNAIINKVGFQTTLKPEEKFERKIMSYTPEQLFEWQSEILPYYAKLLLMYAETGYFPPNFTNCESKFGKCDFLGVCESNPAMREEELKIHFKVGPPWNPTNEDGDTD